MTRDDLQTIAKRLAKAHRAEDPDTTSVLLSPSDVEIRLVEVSTSVETSDPPSILPFRFTPQPSQGVPCESVVILLSPDEWEMVKQDRLHLPTDWDKDNLQELL
jgi:hypothetical protein